MSAVGMRLRAEARGRWRAWLGLALAFGLAGGLATAAAAGARRTATAYPRFYQAYEGYDAVTGGMGEGSLAEIEERRRAIMALPSVAEAATGTFVAPTIEVASGTRISFPQVIVFGDPSGAELFTVNRALVHEGRMMDPDVADEAVVDVLAAERLGIGLGDRISVVFENPWEPERSALIPIDVVGLTATPGSMPAAGASAFAAVNVSPAFFEAHGDLLEPSFEGPSVRLHDGESIEAFIRDARAIEPRLDIPIVKDRHLNGVSKTLRFDVAALWVLAALIALSSLVILGQALARHIMLEASSSDALRSLGATRRSLIGIDLVRALTIGAAAALVAVGTAYAISPLSPRGLARLVEPMPGFHVDGVVFAIGAAVTIVTPLLASLVPSMLASRRRQERASRPSLLAHWLTAGGAGPVPITGVRLALEPGRGARAVPVRSTIIGIGVAIAAFTAAGTFTSSFEHLIDQPRLYGFNWDMLLGSGDQAADRAVLEGDPEVERFTLGGYNTAVIGERQLIPMVYEPGTVEPTIIDGRAPVVDTEIALGSTLMRELDLAIGDVVRVSPIDRGQDAGGGAAFTVVGRTVIPPVFFQQVEPGEGAALTNDGMLRVDPTEDLDDAPFLVRLRDGVDVTAKAAELRAEIPGLFIGQISERTSEMTALSRSTGLPVLLTNVLLLMAIAILAHTLATSVRRRSRDLAVLKTIGFLGRQVRGAVVWQATAIVALAVAIGLPTGIGLGRTAWRWFADTIGVVPVPVTPLAILLPGVLVGTIVLANVIAAVPASIAARTQAAVVLRKE